MNKVEFRESLTSNQDKAYKTFQEKLIPTIEANSIIGVRTPILKDIARKLSKDNYKDEFLNDLPHKYYEENQIHSFLIELEKDYDKCISLINEFLPYVDNWATCDQANPKVLKKRPNETYNHLKEWMSVNKTYYIRYGIKVLMCYFLDDLFDKKYLDDVANINSSEYYVTMMQGWFFATALAKKWDDTIKYIENNKLNKEVNNITIKKAIESYRISDSQKEYLKGYRVK